MLKFDRCWRAGICLVFQDLTREAERFCMSVWQHSSVTWTEMKNTRANPRPGVHTAGLELWPRRAARIARNSAAATEAGKAWATGLTAGLDLSRPKF
jgi:hypothetical protein